MKRMSNGLLVSLMVVLIAFFISACATTEKAAEQAGDGAAATVKTPDGKLFDHAEFSILHPAWGKNKLTGDQVFGIKTGQYGVPSMAVAKTELGDTPTVNSVAEGMVDYFLTTFGAEGEVLYAEETTLADGTPAIETEIKWQYPGWEMLYSYTLAVAKGDYWTVSYTDLKKVGTDYKLLAKTLTIK